MINIEDMKKLFKSKLLLMVIIIGVTTSLSMYVALKMQTSYTGTIEILVGTSDKEMDYYSEDEVEYYQDLMSIFSERMVVGDFLDETLQSHNINLTSSSVKYNLSISYDDSIPIFTISYGSYSPENMSEVLVAVTDEFTEQVQAINPNINVEVIDGPNISAYYPARKKIVLIGFLAGLIIAVAVVLVIDYFDDTVKNSDELENLLHIPVLGDIPTHERQFTKEDRKNVHS